MKTAPSRERPSGSVLDKRDEERRFLVAWYLVRHRCSEISESQKSNLYQIWTCSCFPATIFIQSESIFCNIWRKMSQRLVQMSTAIPINTVFYAPKLGFFADTSIGPPSLRLSSEFRVPPCPYWNSGFLHLGRQQFSVLCALMALIGEFRGARPIPHHTCTDSESQTMQL